MPKLWGHREPNCRNPTVREKTETPSCLFLALLARRTSIDYIGGDPHDDSYAEHQENDSESNWHDFPQAKMHYLRTATYFRNTSHRPTGAWRRQQRFWRSAVRLPSVPAPTVRQQR